MKFVSFNGKQLAVAAIESLGVETGYGGGPSSVVLTTLGGRVLREEAASAEAAQARVAEIVAAAADPVVEAGAA